MPYLTPKGPALYAGPAVVAGWLGVSRAAFGNWLRRYDDYPEPVAVIAGPERNSSCWRYEQRAEWIEWANGKDVAANPGREGIRP